MLSSSVGDGETEAQGSTMAELRCEGRLPETVGPEGSRAVRRLRRDPGTGAEDAPTHAWMHTDRLPDAAGCSL